MTKQEEKPKEFTEMPKLKRLAKWIWNAERIGLVLETWQAHAHLPFTHQDLLTKVEAAMGSMVGSMIVEVLPKV